MWEHRVPKEAALEEDHLAKTAAAIEKISGRRPVGTRSGHSASLLCKHEYIYRSEGSADQLPHYVVDESGNNCLVHLPFHYVIDDAMFFSFAWLGSENAAQRIPTQNMCSTSGGRRSASNTARAATSTSACIRLFRAGHCGWRWWTG